MIIDLGDDRAIDAEYVSNYVDEQIRRTIAITKHQLAHGRRIKFPRRFQSPARVRWTLKQLAAEIDALTDERARIAFNPANFG